MKRKQIISLFLISLFLLLSFMSISQNGYSVSVNDLNYTFENDNLFESTDIDFDDSYNVRNESQFSGHYPATYSFDNEVGLSGLDVSFITDLTSGNPIVINNLDGHNAVLNLTYSTTFKSDFDNQTSGIVEFWYYKSDNIDLTTLNCYEGGLSIITLYAHSNDLWVYGDYLGGYLTYEAYAINEWIHLKYEWFINNTCNIYVNNIIMVNNENTRNNMTNGINKIRFTSVTTDKVYLDAIGYSWQIYNHYTFEDRPIYSYFDETIFPYTSWTYDHFGANTYAAFNDFVPITGQYIRMNDDSSGFVCLKDFWNENITEGTISFNFRIEDAYNGGARFDLLGTTYATPFFFELNQLYYASVPENITEINDNQWYKIEMTFDCITLSLEVYIDDVFIDTYEMTESMSHFNEILFVTGASAEKNFDIDNLFYSFGYVFGDNMLPDKTYSNYYQTDNYEFTLEGVDELIDIGADNPLDWDDIESSGDLVNIARQGYNGLVYIQSTGNGEYNGIEKTDFTIDNQFIEFDIGFQFTSLTDPTGYTYIDVYSNDSTLIIRFKILTSGELQYYNGSIFNTINSDITTSEDYRLDFVISYELDYCFLDFYIDDIIIYESYTFPLIETGKIGLSAIVFESFTFSVNQIYSLIDYIGIETNNYYPNEYSFVCMDLNESYNLMNHNLLTLGANGNMSVVASINTYTPLGYSALLFEGVLINESKQYLTNTYDDYIEIYALGRLNFYLKSNFSLSYVNIDGVLLTEGTNEYNLVFETLNVNIDESYFYVDSSNRLRFSLVINDENTEYIQASFDIVNIASENRSVSYYSDIDGDSSGYLRIGYSDDSSTFLAIPTTPKITNLMLPQTKNIHELIVIITDFDKDDNDVCTGYITDITLIYFPDVTTTILTTNLMSLIIPLIILIVPTVALYKKLGEVALIPTFMLMSLVCLVADLIDVWLFGLIIFGSISLLIAKKKGVL